MRLAGKLQYFPLQIIYLVVHVTWAIGDLLAALSLCPCVTLISPSSDGDDIKTITTIIKFFQNL